MKKTAIYAILWGLPGLVIAVIVSVAVSAFTAGALWIFILGDNPWPAAVEKAFPILVVLVFFTVWLAFIAIGYTLGKRMEPGCAVPPAHILASIVLTIVPVLFIILYQWNIGNIGPKSTEARCADYCGLKGYSASSLTPQNSPPRMCGCLDQTGREAIKIPLDAIGPAK